MKTSLKIHRCDLVFLGREKKEEEEKTVVSVQRLISVSDGMISMHYALEFIINSHHYTIYLVNSERRRFIQGPFFFL